MRIKRQKLKNRRLEKEKRRENKNATMLMVNERKSANKYKLKKNGSNLYPFREDVKSTNVSNVRTMNTRTENTPEYIESTKSWHSKYCRRKKKKIYYMFSVQCLY